ncbi:D-aminoacyl-tRNA deacylase DtdA [Sesbania bispinosa]|nr:D-aminoacyl-tRNA deacylase DtdA [Sesbania bispinosa]
MSVILSSFMNEGMRVLLHGKGIVEEDDLGKRWEEVTEEAVDEVIFFNKHTAASNKPAFTVHPIGVPHLREGDVPPQGDDVPFQKYILGGNEGLVRLEFPKPWFS